MASQLNSKLNPGREFCKIVSRDGNQLKLHSENLKKILNNCTKSAIKTTFISILGVPQSENQFYTRLLTSYFIHKDEDKSWYAHRPSWPSQSLYSIPNEQSGKDNTETGIYMCLEDFFIAEMYTMKPVQVGVLYLHYNKNDPMTVMKHLEQFIVLVCSRIVEISDGDNELSIFDIRDHLMSMSATPEMICNSVVNIRKSEQAPFQQHKLTSEGASIDSVLSEINRSYEVENFKDFNIVHQNATFSNDDVYTAIVLKKLVYLITDSYESRPKLKSDGEPVLTTDIESFFNQMVDIINSPTSYKKPSIDKQSMVMNSFVVGKELALITKVCKRIQAFCIQEMSRYIQQQKMTKVLFEHMSMGLFEKCYQVIYEVASDMQMMWEKEPKLVEKVLTTKQLLKSNFFQLNKSRWG